VQVVTSEMRSMRWQGRRKEKKVDWERKNVVGDGFLFIF
jgi:hypothetical protein